jgi:hypothetical protein
VEQSALAGILPVQPGGSFGLGLRVAAEDADASGSVALRIDWRDAIGAPITSDAAGPVSPEVDWQQVTGIVAAPVGARSAEVRLVRAAGGSGVLYATGLELLRQRAGATLIRPGSVTSAQILAGSLTADDIRAGKLSTEFLDVASLMRIDAARAGLAVGKSGPEDLFTPGVYLGTDAGGDVGGGGGEGGGGAPGDPPGFAFLAGRVKDGIAQYVRIGSGTGLRLLNARHAVTASLVPNAIDLVASQSYDLPVGTTRISLQMMGGGGAGQSVNTSGTRFTGGAGTLTRVELWDGASYTGLAWEAAGALGGGAPNPRVITAGESSPWGHRRRRGLAPDPLDRRQRGWQLRVYQPSRPEWHRLRGGRRWRPQQLVRQHRRIRRQRGAADRGRAGRGRPSGPAAAGDHRGHGGCSEPCRPPDQPGARGQRRAGLGPALGGVHHGAARRRGAAGAHRHRQLCQARQFLGRLPRSRARSLGGQPQVLPQAQR